MKKDYAKKFWDLFDSGDKDTLEKEYPFSFLVCTTDVVILVGGMILLNLY